MEATLGETISVRFLLQRTNDTEGFIPPAFKGFTVVHGPDTRLEVVNVRGQKVSTVTFAYLLKPERTGILEIAIASARVDGLMVYSMPLYIRVSESATRNPDASTGSDRRVEEAVRKGIFLRLETEKTEVYVGEPFLVTYKLYTRLDSESEVVRRPSFAGFSVVEVQRSDSSEPVEETIGGESYQCYVLRKVHLIPLRDGVFELEPLEVRNIVSLGDPASVTGGSSLSRLLSRLYPEGGYKDMDRKVELDLRSPARSIRVRPLPPGAPADFTGVVGRFRLSVAVDRDTLPARGSGTLKLTLEGSGNLPLAGHPKVEWPLGFEAFGSELVEESDPHRAPLSGKRTLVLPFTSDRPGIHAIGVSPMSAFDPTTGGYYKLNADPVKVIVSSPLTSNGEETVSDTGARGKPLGSAFLFTAGLAVLASVAAWLLLSHRRRKPARVESVAPSSEMTSASFSFDIESVIRDTERMLSEGRTADACRELHRALARTAELRFGLGPSEGRDEFIRGLVRNGLSFRKAEEWWELLVGCEVEAFRPVADAGAAAGLLERAVRLLD